MNALQQMLKELKDREIHMAGQAMGIVTLEDASDILQILEIKLLNEYGTVHRFSKRIPEQLSKSQKATIRVAEDGVTRDTENDHAISGRG